LMEKKNYAFFTFLNIVSFRWGGFKNIVPNGKVLGDSSR